MNWLLNLKKNLRKNNKAQIFLICTIIITIYMLSFITIIYELNVTQYSRTTELNEFQATYDNFKTETNAFMNGMLANYSQIATVIDSNITAGTILQNWLDFAESQILTKGYFAVLEINEIVPVTLPIEVVKGNGFISIRANIDIYLECNYLSIDTELQYDNRYTIEYTNTATTTIINFYYETNYGTNYIGYADVTINGSAATNYYNGTYIYNTPVVATDVIQGITPEQIIVSLTV